MRVFRIILFLLIAVADLAKWILIGTGFNLFPFVISMAIVILEIVNLKKKKPVKNPALFMIGTVFSALIVVWISGAFFGYGKMGVYELKLKYARKAGYSTEHFPAVVPDGAVLEDMRMIPTIMQGSGYVDVLLSADDKKIIAWGCILNDKPRARWCGAWFVLYCQDAYSALGASATGASSALGASATGASATGASAFLARLRRVLLAAFLVVSLSIFSL